MNRVKSSADFQVPKRVHHRREAEGLYPELFSRLIPALDGGDPLMDNFVREFGHASVGFLDEVLSRGLLKKHPKSLKRLFLSLSELGSHPGESRVDSAGQLLLGAGLLGSIVLSFKSIIHGYAAPAGNKPLAFSGRLTSKAARRLNETGRFVQAVTLPGGTCRGAPGYNITLKVRLMHSKVRLMLQSDARWDPLAWSTPINQHDMLATILLFSSCLIQGLESCGLRFSIVEKDDYVELWCRVGRLMGCQESLLPKSYAEASKMQEFIFLTQGSPDEDSRALTHALIEIPPPDAHARIFPAQRLKIRHALARVLIGNELADGLRLRDDAIHQKLPQLFRGVGVVERFGDKVPLYARAKQRMGVRFWNKVIEAALAGNPATFRPPDRLPNDVHTQ